MKIVLQRKAKDYLSVLIGIGFLVLVATNYLIALNFPIYPDEINWRYALSRYFIEGGNYYHYMRGCNSTSVQIPIYFSVQMGILSIYSYLKEGIYFRVLSLSIYSIYIFTLYKYLVDVFEDKKKVYRFILLAVIVTMCNTGFFWNATIRPEILIVLYICIFMLSLKMISIHDHSLLLLLMLLFLWSILCISHPKAIYLLIPNLLLLYSLKKNRLSKVIISFLSILYAILVAKFDYILWVNCQKIPEFEAWLMSMNVNPMKLITEPYNFFIELRENIGNQIFFLFTDASNKISFVINPTIGFIPPVRQGLIVSFINFIIKNIYILNVISAFYFMLKITRCKIIIRIYKFGIFGIYLFIFLIMLLNKTNNNYDVNFWNLILVFLNIISAAYIYPNLDLKKGVILFLIAYMAITTILSYHYFYKIFITTWTRGPLVGPNTPLRYFTTEAEKEIKDDFDKNCKGENDLLLSDDATIISLQDYKEILAPITYTALPFYVNTTPDEGKKRLKTFLLMNYKNPIFYGACVHHSNLPDIFHVKYSYEKYGVCCFNIYEK